MKIVVADRNLLPHREVFDAALPAGATVTWHDTPDGHSVVSDLATADVLVGPKLTAEMGSQAPNLKLVHVAGAGVDGIDRNALPTGAIIANTFHHEGSIAEYVVSSLVSLRRNTLGQDAALRTGVWATSVYNDDIAQPKTLRGAVTAFVGFGHIGARTWSLLKAFGVRGIAITRSGSVDAAGEGLDWAGTMNDLHRALSEADVVVISVPLTEATTGLISTDELAELGAEGLLVNVARGPVVDEKALYAALKDRTIAGAAIDVWYTYPASDGTGEPSTLPFARLDNVIMTPHSSGVTTETFRERAREVVENITRLAAGEPLTNVVFVSETVPA